MKKWFSFILVLVLALVLVGCGPKEDPEPTPGPSDPTPQVEDVKPTKIEISGVKEEIEIGEEFTITVKVLPENATDKIVKYSTSSSAIATVKGGKVTGISAGTATITVTSNADKNVKAEFTVTVIGEEEPDPEPVIIPPTAIEITGKTQVELGKNINLAIKAEPEGAKKDVTWVSSNEAILTVNNGIVKGIALGKATVTATSTLDESVQATFEIEVIEAVEIVTKKPESVEVFASEQEIYEGSILMLIATVYPNEAEQNVIWESTKPEVATIDQTGKVTAVSEGTTYIIAYSQVDNTIKSSRVKIKVLKDETAGIPKPDFQGYNVIFMHNTKLDPTGEDYTSISKLFEQQAWAEIQQEYNCVLIDESFPTDASWGPNRHKWITEQAAVGQAQADFFQVPIGWLGSMVTGNSIVPLDSFYAKWGKSQMASIQKVGSTIQGKLFGVSEGADTTRIYADLGIYFNLGMLEKYKIQNPAELFNKGEWNYSDFTRWVESAQALLPDGVRVLSGHPYYYWIGMVSAAGTKISDSVKVQINIYDDVPIRAAELLRTLTLAKTMTGVAEWMESSGAFFDQTALCSTGWLWFCRAESRWPADVWGEDTRFGYVPFPWPDNLSKEATRVKVGTDEVVWTIAAQRERPTYVTDEDLYRMLVDYFYRVKKYQQADPSFDPEAIRRSTLEKKLDDPESIEAMQYFTFDKTVVDLTDAIYDSISGCPFTGKLGSIVNSGTDYMAAIGEVYEAFENKFLALYGLGA